MTQQIVFNANCLDLVRSKRLDKVENLCIVTDPPFNINFPFYGKYKDKLPEEQYYLMLKEVLTSYEKEIPFVVIHYPEQMYKISHYTKTYPERVMSWVYTSNMLRHHRDIGFFNVKPDISRLRQPYKDPKDKRIQELLARGVIGAKTYDWWQVNQVKNFSKSKTNHPCQMPLDIMKNILAVLPKHYIIFDPFTGSGTTGVACKQLGFDFIGCEIDKDYYDTAKKRIEAAKFGSSDGMMDSTKYLYGIVEEENRKYEEEDK